ncbi:MAG: hypothetical protein JXA41_05660 [Deltaproteobacteria bacterium]|nr:hypothetical protein [Deltaproteobacteria bacterium]
MKFVVLENDKKIKSHGRKSDYQKKRSRHAVNDYVSCNLLSSYDISAELFFAEIAV